MSLVGSLEDLGLGDILQIISLSRKSGVLSLRSGEGEGHIFFCDGEVRGARLKDGPSDLRSLLTAAGALSASACDTAERQAPGRSLGETLLEQGVLPRERLEAILLAHLQTTIARMFRWRIGEFSFEPRDGWNEERDLFVSAGVSAQFLAMEGARQLDEDSPDAGARRAPGTPVRPVEPVPRAPEPLRPRTPAVVVLDPELPVLEWIKASLARSFPRVHIFQHADQAMMRARQYLARAEELLFLLSTEASGDRLTGARNTAEIAARVRAHSPRVSVLLLVGRAGAPAGLLRRAADGFVQRPGAAELGSPEAGLAFGEAVRGAFEASRARPGDGGGRGGPAAGTPAGRGGTSERPS